MLPHIPESITRLEQRFPIRFGKKRLYISTVGQGKVTAVRINGKEWKLYDDSSVTLAYDKVPNESQVLIAFGGAKLGKPSAIPVQKCIASIPAETSEFWSSDITYSMAVKLIMFCEKLQQDGLRDSAELAHAKLTLECIATAQERMELLEKGEIVPLATDERQIAANGAYRDTIKRLYHGLDAWIETFATIEDDTKKRIYQIWSEK